MVRRLLRDRRSKLLENAKLQKQRKEKVANRSNNKKKDANQVKSKPVKESQNLSSNSSLSRRNIATSCRNCGKKLMGKPLQNHESICTAKRFSHGYRNQGYSGNNGRGRFHNN